MMNDMDNKRKYLTPAVRVVATISAEDLLLEILPQSSPEQLVKEEEDFYDDYEEPRDQKLPHYNVWDSQW